MGAGHQLAEALKRFFFPSFCILCREESRHRLCPSCIPLLQRAPPGCPFCGMENHRGHCPSWAEPFDGALHALETTAAVKRLLKEFRGGARFLARELAAWIVVAALEKEWAFDEVTFVPSPPFRRAMRGFTPAELLAQEVATLLDLPCISYLKRRGGEPSQEHFTLAERRRAPSSTFFLKGTPRGKRLLLVDDTLVSGSTLHHTGLLLRGQEPLQLFAAVLFANLSVE